MKRAYETPSGIFYFDWPVEGEPPRALEQIDPHQRDRERFRIWWQTGTGVQPATIASVSSVPSVTILDTNPDGTPADAQLFIAGVSVSWEVTPGDPGNPAPIVSLSSAQITKVLGQQSKFVFTLHSAAVASRPSPFDEVIFYRKGVRRFAGYITKVTDVIVVSTATTEYGIECADYNGYLDRAIVAKLYTISTGSLCWIIIFDLVQNYLSQFGITYQFEGDPDILLGQVLFHYLSVAQAITQILQSAPGWYVTIDAFKQLHFRQQGGAAAPAAPYSLSDTSLNFQSIAVEIDTGMYANKRWVIPSVNVASFKTDTFTGDGTTRSFITSYPLNQAPTVKVDGVLKIVTALGTWGSYYDFYYIPGGQGVFQNPGNAPLTGANTLTVTYPNPFQLGVSAENDTEIALRGLVEAAYFPTDLTNVAQAQNLAAGLLAAYCPNVPEIITFVTNEQIEPNAGGWLEPGSMITISTTLPKVTGGTYLVQEVDSTEEDLTFWSHQVIARKQNGPTDAAGTLARLTQQALAATNNYATETAALELASTITGVTNPGLAISPAPPNRYVVQNPGVLAYWSLLAAANPPTGADLKIDIRVNGTSIFPTGVYATLPAGQTTEEQGSNFASLNLSVSAGDIISWVPIQVGSTFGGADILSKLVWKI